MARDDYHDDNSDDNKDHNNKDMFNLWDESLNVLTFTFCVFQYHTHNLRHADTITVFVVLQYHTLFLDECTHLIRIISLVSHLLLKLFFRHTLDFFQFSVSHSK